MLESLFIFDRKVAVQCFSPYIDNVVIIHIESIWYFNTINNIFVQGSYMLCKEGWLIIFCIAVQMIDLCKNYQNPASIIFSFAWWLIFSYLKTWKLDAEGVHSLSLWQCDMETIYLAHFSMFEKYSFIIIVHNCLLGINHGKNSSWLSVGQ